MPIDHLSEFLDQLAESGELVRVGTEVNPHLELSAIAQRVTSKEHDRAVLFENVGGRSIPAVSGIFGTEARTRRALAVESLSDLADRITALIQPDLPAGWLEALQLIPRFAEMAKWPTRKVDTALSQQVVHMGSDVDLARLPIPVSWPQEPWPTITAGQILVEESIGSPSKVSSVAPGSGDDRDVQKSAGPSPFTAQQDGVAPRTETPVLVRHASRVPVQIIDRNTVLVYWNPHHPEWQLVSQRQGSDQQTPVAIALGGDPVLTLAVGAPLPPFVDPFVFAGFIRQANVEIAGARSISLDVPANAEIVLEGIVDPEKTFESAQTVAAESGYYDAPGQAVRVTVTALTHRANPVFPVMIPAAPPSEAGWLDHATERILLPLIRMAIPELVDLRMPAAGAYRNIAFAGIRKAWPQQARKVMNALWGFERLSRVKMLVVVDEEVDVHDDDAVWHAVGANAHPGRDTIYSEGPADMLDHAAPVRGVGHRMGIDATRKSAEEGHPRPWPDALVLDEETERLVSHRWFTYGISNGKNGKSGS